MKLEEIVMLLKKLGPYGIAAVLLSLVPVALTSIALDHYFAKEIPTQAQFAATNKKLEETINALQNVNGQLSVLMNVLLPKAMVSTVAPLPPKLTMSDRALIDNPPPITPAQQKAIDAAKPADVSLTMIKNNTVVIGETLKNAVAELQAEAKK